MTYLQRPISSLARALGRLYDISAINPMICNNSIQFISLNSFLARIVLVLRGSVLNSVAHSIFITITPTPRGRAVAANSVTITFGQAYAPEVVFVLLIWKVGTSEIKRHLEAETYAFVNREPQWAHIITHVHS